MNAEISTTARKKDVAPSRSLEMELASILSLEKELKEDTQSEGEKYLIVSIERGDSLAIGTTITEVDRELRRTVRIFLQNELSLEHVAKDLVSREYRTERLPTEFVHADEEPQKDRSKDRAPRPVLAESTRLLAFNPGSGHMLFEVVGFAWNMLASEPLSVMLNLIALTQGARWAGTRIRVFRDRRAKHAPRDMLDSAAKHYGDLGKVLGPPEHDVRLGAAIEASRIVSRLSLVDEKRNDAGKVIERKTTMFETFR